ncbi:MAG: hypothetical protein SF066_21945 [Thermoanaerobaculia bacterium]|nr:hypothetical protein [Thermoanaerobaculia bacterium]
MRYLLSLLSLLIVWPAAADLRPVPLRGEESNLPEAIESCGHSEPQVVSRGAVGFLSVWLQEGNVVARRVGAAGFPEGPQIAVSPAVAGVSGKASGARVVRQADGTFVVAWLQQISASRREIQFRRLGEDGTPVGSVQSVLTLGPTPALGGPALASSSDGFFSIVWTELDSTPASPVRLAIRGRIFNAQGFTVGATRTAATFAASDLLYRSAPQLAAVMTSGSNVLVAWPRPGDHSVIVGPLSTGAPSWRVLYLGPPDQQEQGVSLAVVQGGVLITYKSIALGTGTTALVEKLTAAGDRIGEPFYWPLPLILGTPTLAADLDGSRAALQWSEPTQPFDTEGTYALLLNSDGRFLDPSVFSIRLDDPTTETFGPEHHLRATRVAFGPGGKLAATWQVWREAPFSGNPCDTGVAARVQTFELDEEPVFTPPDPPAGPYLTSPSVPGFRYKVRLAGNLAGKSESACLVQTACVSGAVAGRPEVLLRVVGPRPNGRLWPTIVRFTTAQVEVWIEQVATGTRRYYLLPALDPDSSDLGGTVDRDGFPVL